ncbi:IucA/IucC family protein [Staphylococcus canis]|uniref:Sialic acid synthase n=1 Tax=Staphylococcus canis TaxID=2724942 RepID=A0ABS0TAV2_9STAP|nr:IucA/IucC family protein [Staphylococcus canis]MBI5975886.1 sialic acid synthase [Staphylococcus canis]
MDSNQNVTKDDLTHLTQEEMACYETLTQHDSVWAQAFLDYVQYGRDKITARLVSSIYRENLVQGFDHARILHAHQLPESPIHSGDVLSLHFTYTKQTLCSAIVGIHAFRRIDVQGPFYWQDGHHFKRVAHPNEILDIIIQEDDTYQGDAAEQFRDDLENSAANMIMAISYQSLYGHPMNIDTLTRESDPYLLSEERVIEGHPLHPGAKLRKGMTTFETMRYASEYSQPINLKFILVHQDVIRVQSVHHSYTQTVFQMFDGLKKAAQAALTTESLDTYHVMIVHPWQYDHVMDKDYTDALQSRSIIPIDYTHTYYAGLSFRTLMPKYPDVSPHIKLSTNVHITGEIRTLSEQTTHNGPLVSQILDDITANDTWFDTVPAQHIAEIAGAHFYQSKDADAVQERRSEQLGTLYRRNVYHYVEPDTIPVIASSLIVADSKTDIPLIIALIERYISIHPELETSEAIRQWFQTYATALIDFVIPLLVKYGIALEAHLQNTIAVFNPTSGTLNQMLVRDFEGLRIDAKQLAAMNYKTDHFHEKSRILTDSQTSVFNKAFYSTIQNHLGELVAPIVKYYHMQGLEQLLWDQVRIRIQELFTVFRAADLDESRLDRIEGVFFHDTIDYKCVTTMRLLDEAHHYTYVKVQNPLALNSSN